MSAVLLACAVWPVLPGSGSRRAEPGGLVDLSGLHSPLLDLDLDLELDLDLSPDYPLVVVFLLGAARNERPMGQPQPLI